MATKITQLSPRLQRLNTIMKADRRVKKLVEMSKTYQLTREQSYTLIAEIKKANATANAVKNETMFDYLPTEIIDAIAGGLTYGNLSALNTAIPSIESSLKLSMERRLNLVRQCFNSVDPYQATLADEMFVARFRLTETFSEYDAMTDRQLTELFNTNIGRMERLSARKTKPVYRLLPNNNQTIPFGKYKGTDIMYVVARDKGYINDFLLKATPSSKVMEDTQRMTKFLMIINNSNEDIYDHGVYHSHTLKEFYEHYVNGAKLECPQHWD